MSFGGPKNPTNLSLSKDLVAAARSLTPNLSETVEALLAAYVETERKRRAKDERRIREMIDFSNRLHEEAGLAGAEYMPI